MISVAAILWVRTIVQICISSFVINLKKGLLLANCVCAFFYDSSEIGMDRNPTQIILPQLNCFMFISVLGGK